MKLIKLILKLFFDILDFIYSKIDNLQPIPNSKDNTFYYSIQKYKGKNFQLVDGTIIQHGDCIIELHINNKNSDLFGNEIKSILKSYNTEMKLLAKALVNHPKLSEVKFIYARTLFYPIVNKKGFEIREIDNKILKKFLKIWDNLIKYAYEDSKHKIKFREAKEIWISSEKFIKQNS